MVAVLRNDMALRGTIDASIALEARGSGKFNASTPTTTSVILCKENFGQAAVNRAMLICDS